MGMSKERKMTASPTQHLNLCGKENVDNPTNVEKHRAEVWLQSMLQTR